jgi:hypothetical protein
MAWAIHEREQLSPGEGGPLGRPGMARRLLRGGAPAPGRPPPRSATPDRSARGPRRNDRGSWRAREGQRPRAPGRRGQGKRSAAVRSGEKCVPRTTARNDGYLPEPVKLRPQDLSKSETSWLLHLTEPVRWGGSGGPATGQKRGRRRSKRGHAGVMIKALTWTVVLAGHLT